MMIEELVLTKLRSLSKKQQEELLNFLEFLEYKSSSFPANFPATENMPPARLAKAAQALLADYNSDEELTAFIVLDGEAFHA